MSTSRKGLVPATMTLIPESPSHHQGVDGILAVALGTASLLHQHHGVVVLRALLGAP